MAKNMKVTEKTIIFILTLFTTVGTYCENSPKDRYILEEILKMLKNEETDIIYTAIDLRTKENDIWDDLYKGKTEELTKKFKKDLIKIKATN